MAEEGKSPSLLAPVGLVWVISLLVGLPFGAAHKTVAPAPAKGDHNTESSVPAGNKAYCRLWEDPLEAAGALSYQKTAKDNFEKGQDSNSASFSGVARTLFILARGSRYADMGEWRRQQRYAVQAALWNKGYAPVHAEYLGYHDIPLSQVVSSRERPSTVEDDAYFRVPFELFRKEKSTDRLAVCYINLALLEESHALRSLYLIAKGMGLEKTQLDVSTPPSTDLLNSMLAEGESRNPAKNADFETMLHSLPVEKPAEMQIFNTLATGELKGFNTTGGDTVPHAHIDLKAGPSNYLNATVYNLIESDAQTAQRIVGELELRHENLDGPGWMRGQCIVAVVSEWETQFGREFAGRMRAAGNGQKELGSARIGQMNVEAYDYLRGLNGLAPDGRTSSPVPELPSPTQRAEDAHTPGEALSRTIEPPPLPAPFGTSQFDYIARLGEELLHKNAEKKSSGQGEFRAFCLIGTDVDDKLALLKVLRPRFPDALFFTNDMSAEYLQPENNAIARNLIVETCYGLDDTLGDKKKDGMQSRSRIALSNDGQKNAKLPRFRTSTQVAIVDSIEAALSEASLDERLVKPVQLFEVGLRRWHPLDPITQQAQAKENERQGTESSSAKQPGGAKPKSGDSVKHLEWAGSLPTGAWLFFWLALIGVLWHFLLSISERGKWEKRPGIVGALLKCSAHYCNRVKQFARHLLVCLLQDAKPEPETSTVQLLRQGLIASVPDLPDEPGSRRASGWWIYAGAVALWGLDWWLLVESWNSTLALGGGLLVAVCGVVALAWLLLNPREDHQNVASMILLGAAVVWGGVLMGRLLANDYPGEPWALADGVCLWPGVVMRMVAGALAFYFVGRAWRDVCKWRSELTHRFFLEREGGIPGGVRHSSSKLAEGAQPATGHGVVPRDFPDHRGIDQGSNPFSDAPDNSANEAEVWAKYLDNSDPRRSRPAARWVRLTLAMLLVSCAAMLLAGFPAANSRGVVAKVGDFVSLGIALVGLVILCVFIGDQLWQCRRFVRRIWLHGTTGFGFELEEMLLLVSKVTAGAGNLLSYPFAVSFVLLCAHSGYFEQWFGLHGLYAMIGLALGTLALFTWKMQRTAHEVREKTVAHLKISLAEALWLKRLVLQRLDFAPQHKQEKSWWEYTVARLGRHIIIPEETRTAAVFRRYGGVPPMNDPQYAAFMAELKVSREIDTQFQEARIKRIEQLIAIATSLREGAFGSLKDNPIVRGILIPGAGLGSLELIQRLIVG